MSVGRRGWLLLRRALLSWFRATRRRYQRISVSGVTNVSSFLSALRPSFFAAVANRRRCPSVYLKTPPAKLLVQYRVFRQQVFGDALVISRHPSGYGEQQKPKRQTRHAPILALAARRGKPYDFSAIVSRHSMGWSR
jgi:hypothetical protein